MKKLLIFLVLGTLFVACTTPIIERLDTPFREHGYNNYASKVITSQSDFDRFLTQVANDSDWNNKVDFLDVLQDRNIDFNTHNLLFYRLTETSGSVKLTIHAPSIVAYKKVYIKIDKNAPEGGIGTADMAYYALSYEVSKNVETITFDDGGQNVIVENKQSDMMVPKNCLAWFDGCNNCSKMENNQVVCTKKYCIVHRPEDFRCTKWK